VLNATIALVKNPKGGLLEVLKHVHGPDFPTAGILYGRAGIVDAYRTGRGRFLMRARVAIENVTKDRQALIVTELPYQVNKSRSSSASPSWSKTRSSPRSTPTPSGRAMKAIATA